MQSGATHGRASEERRQLGPGVFTIGGRDANLSANTSLSPDVSPLLTQASQSPDSSLKADNQEVTVQTTKNSKYCPFFAIRAEA